MIHQNQPKKLYRSRNNRVLCGVCGGLGEYSNIDPVVVRVLFVLATIFGGWGLLLYVIMCFIVPENPQH